jgi:hypothetical protein
MNEFDLKGYLYNNPLLEKKEDSKKGNKEMQKKLEGAIRDDRDHKFNIDKDEDEQRKKLAKLKKDAKKETGKGLKGNKDEQKRAEGAIKDAKDHKEKLDGDIKDNEKKLAKLKKDFKDDVNEGMDKEDKKLTKEGLKSMIRERITSILNEETIDEGDDYYEDVTEQEDDEVDVDVQNKVDVKDKEEVDVDIEKEKEIDDVSKETDIDVKTSLPGESEDVDAVLGLLTKASEEAGRFSDDEELKTQIGNVITYFTRKHVAK